MDEKTPYLLNISDDPTLAGCIMLVVKEGMNQLGYGKDCGIKVKGLGIREVHCGV